jgi:hypothetical protein
MSQIVACQLKSIPDINWVFCESKEFLHTEFYILETEVRPLALEMIHQSFPEKVLIELKLDSILKIIPWLIHYFSKVSCNNWVFFDLLRAILVNCLEVVFFNFDYRFCFSDKQIVGSLKLSRIIIASSWS